MEVAVVYRFHIALRGVSPKIWRRVELTAGSSLADLQRVIQISLGWSDVYQHRFRIRNHYLGASRPGGLLFFGDPEAMTLSQFAFRLHERFTYEYNFLGAWLFDIRFEGEHAFDPKRHYPRCVAGVRRAPLEDSGGAEIFMDRQSQETPAARKIRHAERKLRDMAKLLEDESAPTPGLAHSHGRIACQRANRRQQLSIQISPVDQHLIGILGRATPVHADD